jgi:hypothetical protein
MSLYARKSCHTNGRIRVATVSGQPYVLWTEDSVVKRLPGNFKALPLTNMWIQSVEVTQGFSSKTQDILGEGRRTFVRVEARADGESVAGVTAYLYRSATR